MDIDPVEEAILLQIRDLGIVEFCNRYLAQSESLSLEGESLWDHIKKAHEALRLFSQDKVAALEKLELEYRYIKALTRGK